MVSGADFKEYLTIEVDISGQIQQINMDSSLGMRRTDGLEKSVFLDSRVKKEILKQYKGQITNLIEKLHCILIYYCIKDSLENVDLIEICKDVSFRKVKKLLPLLFVNNLRGINIKQRDSKGFYSAGHRIAIKTLRNKKLASLIIKKEMVEDVLLKFKK